MFQDFPNKCECYIFKTRRAKNLKQKPKGPTCCILKIIRFSKLSTNPSSVGRVEWANCFPCVSCEATKVGQVRMATRARRGITSTLQFSAGETTEVRANRYQYLLTSRDQSPLHSTSFFVWCDILLTRSHHSL